jgi:histone deacetylase 1/2
MSVVAYFRKLKSVADHLGDVGAPVTDKKLTMRLIDGLDRRFRTQGELLEGGITFPTFMQAQSRLQLAEQKLKAEETETPQFLHANGNNGGPDGHGGSSAPTFRFNGTCYSCGEPGHMARNCTCGDREGGQQGRGGGPQYTGRGGGQLYVQYRRGRGRGRGRGDHWTPPNAAGVLGPRPGAHNQVYHMAYTNPTPPPMQPVYTPPQASSYDYSAMFHAAPSNTTTFHPGGDWVMDSGATTHVTNSTGNLTSSHSLTNVTSRSIVVGNGSTMPIYSVGSASLPPRPFHLNHVLVSPAIIKSLISVRKFMRDNFCSIEFDPYGFSMKDLATRTLLLRSSSSGDMYPFFGDLQHTNSALTVSTTRDLWHRRLGHPSEDSLSKISSDFPSSCNKTSTTSSICEACQLGRQPRLSFSTSTSFTTSPFQLIHCDLWTSPIYSFSGNKYYLTVLDDYSHYSWAFPIRNKSDTASILQRFFVYVKTQFNKIIQCVQCDNGGEFLNSELRSFFSTNGISFRFSCPHTSPQNGKAERMLRTTNDVIRTLLVQSNLPPTFWVEALHTANHLINIRPSRAINHATPHFRLFNQHPTYSHLRVFGCLCFPNLYATTHNKL